MQYLGISQSEYDGVREYLYGKYSAFEIKMHNSTL